MGFEFTAIILYQYTADEAIIIEDNLCQYFFSYLNCKIYRVLTAIMRKISVFC